MYLIDLWAEDRDQATGCIRRFLKGQNNLKVLFVQGLKFQNVLFSYRPHLTLCRSLFAFLELILFGCFRIVNFAFE